MKKSIDDYKNLTEDNVMELLAEESKGWDDSDSDATWEIGAIRLQRGEWRVFFDPYDPGPKGENDEEYIPPDSPMQLLAELGFKEIMPCSLWDDQFNNDVALKRGIVEGMTVWFRFQIIDTTTSTQDGTEYDYRVAYRIISIKRPYHFDEEREIIELCERIVRAGGYCTHDGCQKLKGSTIVAKRWQMCIDHANQAQRHEENIRADPLYDLRQWALSEARNGWIKMSWERDPNQWEKRAAAATAEEELRQIIDKCEQVRKERMAYCDLYS